MTWETRCDLVVVGSGVAGLTAARTARQAGLRVLVISKAELTEGSTAWAQGGIACADGAAPGGDSVQRHAADTLTAGAGLCAPEAVHGILADGGAALRRLQETGVRFDRDAGGGLARTREGGHTAFRVVHCGGDATGAEVHRALSDSTRGAGTPVLERHCVVDVLRGEDGAVVGALVLDEHGRPGTVRAPAVLLATGGIGQLYAVTTNPEIATADGLALALRAGACVADVEFVQFHPTALCAPGAPDGSRPLITEAVRGEGGVLVDGAGRRIMADKDPRADLAPRDVVAAALDEHLRRTGGQAFLDTTGVDRFAERFPTVTGTCRAAGIDPVAEPIPVAPAAHYACGGVVTDLSGRTSVPGLYAAGEVARTGLHGANRLASNSLLEGLVVGERAARAVARDTSGQHRRCRVEDPAVPAHPVVDRGLLQRTMGRHAALERSAGGLREAAEVLDRTAVVRPLQDRRAVEESALALAGQTLLTAAELRTESRGCHRRGDFPEADGQQARSVVLRLDVSGALIRTTGPGLARAAA
ncbi:L-aspartate oxidase [Salinifilum ghardaiensis]